MLPDPDRRHGCMYVAKLVMEVRVRKLLGRSKTRGTGSKRTKPNLQRGPKLVSSGFSLAMILVGGAWDARQYHQKPVLRGLFLFVVTEILQTYLLLMADVGTLVCRWRL